MKTGYANMRCGLIGEHLGHSFSPQIHSELADYSYGLFELKKEEIGAFMRDGGLDAFNVTIPYKTDVIPFLDFISPEAEAIGAVNTVVRRNGKLFGYNTDYFGFEYMVKASGINVKGEKAIVFGTGGASLTVQAVLKDMGVSQLALIGIEDNTPENLALHSDAKILVNATPVGMYPHNGSAPVDLSLFPECILVLDVIYNPNRTALVLEAERRGITAVNGLPMLVAQAAKAFEFFVGEPYEEGCIERIVSDISAKTRNIIFIGMPGCGKSTVGRLLAKELGREFFDGDSEFETLHGITPAEAIKTLGEDRFREMEHVTLEGLTKKSGAVIACGGGVVTREYNYPLLHQNGVILFLERKLENLSTEGRPLSQRNSLTELYKNRIDAYRRFADITLHSTEVPEKTVLAARELLSEWSYTCLFKNES